MPTGDKSLIFGTIFEDDLSLDWPVSDKKTSKKKDRKPKKIVEKPSPVVPYSTSPLKRHFSEKELKEYTTLDWFAYFSEKCKLCGYKYFEGSKTTHNKELEILHDMMQEFSPEQIKGIIDFIWDVWDCPKITKSSMRITIFCTGWMPEIYNSYLDLTRGCYKTYSQRDAEKNNVNRGCKSEETNSDVIHVGKGIFI